MGENIGLESAGLELGGHPAEAVPPAPVDPGVLVAQLEDDACPACKSRVRAERLLNTWLAPCVHPWHDHAFVASDAEGG